MEPTEIYTPEVLASLFPAERTNEFFDALFGDADEGAYDITLSYEGFDASSKTLGFFINLHERPGRCLACNLTHGLPEVFKRHPIINVKGLCDEAVKLLGENAACADWQLGRTLQKEKSMHCIPLQIQVVGI
nr:pancreas/duodenum homeobox protein 1 [uncultured Desulfobulbus sp.]